MHSFILAPDSFKGTMSADEVCSIWEESIKANIPGALVRRFPIADGGEGMVDAYLRICGGEKITACVTGPFGEQTNVHYGILPGGAAVMEMASCAGLPLVGNHKDPERASTYGLGEMILHAAGRGAKEIILGLGGSATNDCGIGMAASLGYHFFDDEDHVLEPLALNLGRVSRIEAPTSMPEVRIIAACDVDNPLYGPTGATYTFGVQKGTTAQSAAKLDSGLKNMATIIAKDLGVEVANLPGSGAAGGLGAGVVAFLKGKLMPGVELLLDAAGFDEALKDADIVFTGEGRIDWQSASGKAPVGISRRCKKAGIPCIALCGSIGAGAEAVYEEGITAIFSAVAGAADFDDIKRTCKDDMRLLATSVTRLLLSSGCKKGL